MYIRNSVKLIMLAMICAVDMHAQIDSIVSAEGGSRNLSWIAPVITDEMTKDPEQNRQYRLGQSKYSAQPRNMWELGLHGGHFFIDGDIDPRIPAGFGAGMHLRRALTYFTSIRFDAFYGITRGLEKQPWRHRNFGGGLVETNDQFTGWEAYNGSAATANNWFPSYETKYMYGSAQLVFNIGNVLFHKERNRWNTYVAIGVGLDHHETMLDLLDTSNNPYEALRERAGFTRELFNTKEGRDLIAKSLDAIYDGVYETEGFKKVGVFRLGDDFNIHPIFTGSVGVSRKLSRRINLALEHQVMLSDNDYLDGIKYRTANDQSNSGDVAHYTNMRLAFNLGSFNKKTEPLFWLNPMENIFNDLSEVKSRPKFEWIDEDGDGVLDLVDQELDTPEGCMVDTKGVTLDSDGDGVVDCKDKEPFSPPGYTVDEFGVAQIDRDKLKILTEEDVITIIQNNCHLCQNKGIGLAPVEGGTINAPGSAGPGKSNVSGYGVITNSTCGNWFLPMLHFDLDKYALRPESYPKVHQVAYVMKNCPEMCITAQGFTDARSSNRYNDVLSYNRAKEAIDHIVKNYGVERSRFKLMFGGEGNPLIPNLPAHHYTSRIQEEMQFINRRVEFRVCEEEDIDMSRPEGPEAGVRSFGASRPGSKYKMKTDKNSGY